MKLYYSKGACSLAIRILINELKLKCEYEAVDLKAKQTETGKDFLAINPKGAVPTLELDDGTILTESAVIHQYLADYRQAFQLLPAIVDINRYAILADLNYVSTELHKGFGTLFNSKLPDQVKNEVIIPGLINKFKFIELKLENNAYLCGDDYTLPDGYLFVILMWVRHFPQIDFSRFPNINRYAAMLKERPSIQLSLAEENL